MKTIVGCGVDCDCGSNCGLAPQPAASADTNRSAIARMVFQSFARVLAADESLPAFKAITKKDSPIKISDSGNVLPVEWRNYIRRVWHSKGIPEKTMRLRTENDALSPANCATVCRSSAYARCAPASCARRTSLRTIRARDRERIVRRLPAATRARPRQEHWQACGQRRHRNR